MKYSRTALRELTRLYRVALLAAIMGTVAVSGTAKAVVITEDINLNEAYPTGVITDATEDGKAYDSTDPNGYTSSLTTQTINITASGDGKARGVDFRRRTASEIYAKDP